MKPIFKINGYYKIKHPQKTYPWPCGPTSDRTIELYDDDVLTPYKGKWMKHTGLCCFGFEIPTEDLIEINEEISLQLM